MSRISVIIPVYNASEYIVRCLDSLKNQTLHDVEVIIIDDYSTDNTAEMIDSYINDRKLMASFKLFLSKENSGPGVARNLGIRKATGKYIVFVDGDDWIETNALENMYTQAEKYDTDLCYCNIMMNLPDGRTKDILNPYISSGDFNYTQHKEFLVNFVTYCYSYIYRREFLLNNGIEFPSGRTAEDSVFLIHCILACNRIAYVNESLYHYVINSNSLTQSKNSERYKQKLENISLVLSMIDIYPQYKQELEYIYIKKGYIMSIMNYIRDNRRLKIDVLQDVYKRMKDSIPEYRRNYYYQNNLKIRLLIFLLSKMPMLSTFIFSILFRLFSSFRMSV